MILNKKLLEVWENILRCAVTANEHCQTSKAIFPTHSRYFQEFTSFDCWANYFKISDDTWTIYGKIFNDICLDIQILTYKLVFY